ncbi:MAG: DsbA family protein [Longimicrobiales bacterium]
MCATRIPLALLAVALVGPAGVVRPAPAGAQAIDVNGLGHAVGDPSAPIQVVEFSDYSCPQCRVFHASTQDSLRVHFVDTGKAYWITIPYASGLYPRSEAAAAAAECAAEQGRHELMRDRLYERQAEWSSASANTARRLFRGYARDLALNVPTFVSCADSERTRSRIEAARRLADDLGVRGTPTFFIDGFPALALCRSRSSATCSNVGYASWGNPNRALHHIRDAAIPCGMPALHDDRSRRARQSETERNRAVLT